MLVVPILISGPQGSGKSTLAHELIVRLNSMEKFYAKGFIFANTIYQIHNFARGYMRSVGIDRPEKDGKLLQMLGTEFGRKTIGEDVWVKACKGEIENWVRDKGTMHMRMIPIISDCRFKNEFDGFPEALRVRLECPEETRKQRCNAWREDTKHPSEVDLDEYARAGKFDLLLHTGDLSANMCADLINQKLMDIFNGKSK